MSVRPRIYLAGPTVFMPDARAHGNALKALCEAHGCDGLFSLEADMGNTPDARRIIRECLAMLDRSQAIVADLSPFRGPHVDDGTAFELGYAFARELPIFTYATDLRPLAARIPPRAAGDGVDADGITIERLGEPFNAIIAGALACPAFATADKAIAAAARVLNGAAQ